MGEKCMDFVVEGVKAWRETKENMEGSSGEDMKSLKLSKEDCVGLW